MVRELGGRPKLEKANFDTEFFAPYYIEIQKEFKEAIRRDFAIYETFFFIQKLLWANV